MAANEGEWEAGVERLYEAVGREDELAQAFGALRPAFGADRSELFHDVDVPLLVVRRDGAVMERNPAAQAVFDAAEPLLRLRANRLMMATARGWQPLAPQLAALEDGAEPAFSVDLAN